MNLSVPAQDYLSEGFNPLPLWAAKNPNLPKGHPYLYEPVSILEINKLFSNTDKIGIACGDVSNGFECIDFDAKHGEPVREIFNKFMADEGVKEIIIRNKLPIVKTPSGGYHIYYRHQGKKCPPMHLASWESGTVMIETRGDGSYVATIPSDGYKQVSGSSILEIARIDKDERDYLLSVAEGFSQKIITKSEKLTKGKWPTKFDTSTVWGKYNEEETTEMKDILTDNGWTYIDTRKRDGVEYWQRPGKNERMPVTGATFGRCHNMFYCFTDSVPPFEQRTSYTPFDIFIIYKHKGNKKSAIQDLENRYSIKHYKTKQVITEELEPTPPLNNDKFPIEVFPACVQTFINELNSSLNFSTDFLSIAIMFSMATLNGNKIKLRVKNEWISPTVFWFAAVGEPGTMKSHPISSIIKPIKEIDKESKKSYDNEYAEYERQIIETKNKSSIPKPNFKQILITDITLESLHEVHGVNRRGLGYYRDELVGFLFDMNRYHKGSDEQFWLESFNNNSYIVNRVTKRPCLIEDTNINIIGTIQPNVFSKVNKDYSGNGLTDRFLYTSAEKSIFPLTKKDINPELIEWWRSAIRGINATFKYIDNTDTNVMEMHPGALDRLIEIDEHTCKIQASDDITESFKNYLSKSKTYLPRFALLLSLFDYMFIDKQPLVVNKSHIDRADKIMQYFIESARMIFTDAEKTSEINDVMGAKRGMTKIEHIIHLQSTGFKNIDIARMVKVSKSYVGKVINEHQKSKPK
jgi:hypothetical protein